MCAFPPEAHCLHCSVRWGADFERSARVEVSDGNSKLNRGITGTGYDHQKSERLVDWHGGGVHPSGNVGDYRARSRGPGGNNIGGLAADFWRCGALGCGVRRGRSRARHLAGADRDSVHPGWNLLPDTPVAGIGNADATPGCDYPDGGGVRSHRVLSDAERRWLGLAAGECSDHTAPGRANLVPLAIEFSLGNRDVGRREPADDRDFAADGWSGSAEADEPRGGLANALRLPSQAVG